MHSEERLVLGLDSIRAKHFPGGLLPMPNVVLHLLDSDQGRPLQSWSFADRETITLGRADDNDVVIADPYVSRAHAYLKVENGGWKLTSISRQRVVHQGQPWDEMAMRDGMVFRLGPNGCYLRFGDSSPTQTNTKTISFEPTLMPVFQLDREKMEHEVNQITGANYFKQLKDAARQLREQRLSEETRT